MLASIDLEIIGNNYQRGDFHYKISSNEERSQKITLCEDDTFLIRLSLSDTNDIRNAEIKIGDQSIEIDEIKTNRVILTLLTKSDRHLLNHFGISSLSLYINENYYEFPITLNILATKINAEQAEQILLYLDSKNNEILRYCFSKTYNESDSKEGQLEDPSIILQEAEKIIDFVASHRTYLRINKRTKLTCEDRLTPRDHYSKVDETTLKWIFSNLDQLSISNSLECDVVIKGRNYSLNSIQSTYLREDTDTYENQVIYSLFLSIREKLSILLQESPNKVLEFQEGLAGYVSLSNIVSNILPITGSWQRKCRLLLNETNLIIKFIESFLPCTKRRDLSPYLTPFAKSNHIYRQIFHFSNKWYKLGDASWAGQEYLTSLISMPRLYEFLCLYKLNQHINDCGFKTIKKSYHEYDKNIVWTGKESEKPTNQPFNYYEFSNDIDYIALHFEPHIWELDNKNHEDGRLVDISQHYSSPSGIYRPFRSPDFLIRLWSTSSKAESIIIIDAKYSRPKIILDKYMPKIIEKYFWGLATFNKDNNILTKPNIIGILAAFPISNINNISSYDKTPKFIKKSLHPLKMLSVPAISCLELSPFDISQKDFSYKSELLKAISILIEHHKAHISVDL